MGRYLALLDGEKSEKSEKREEATGLNSHNSLFSQQQQTQNEPVPSVSPLLPAAPAWQLYPAIAPFALLIERAEANALPSEYTRLTETSAITNMNNYVRHCVRQYLEKPSTALLEELRLCLAAVEASTPALVRSGPPG